MKFIRNKIIYCYEQGDGKFLEWFYENMNAKHYTQRDLSKMIGVSPQHISNILHKRFKPNKPFVIALWWVFGMKDNPEDIFRRLFDVSKESERKVCQLA